MFNVATVMAGVWLASSLLFLLFHCTLCLDVNQIEVPTGDGISGVLLVVTKDKNYSFNATTAKDACDAIKMRIATKAEVETANQHGLQTCRFGWVEEQIAVIPRTERRQSCGKNKTGVIVWRADISKLFDVYCFKPSGAETTTSRMLEPTTEGGRTSPTHHSSTTSVDPLTIHTSSSPVTSIPPYSSPPSFSSPFNTSLKTFITVSLSSINQTSQVTTSTQVYSTSRTLRKFSTSHPSSSSHLSTNTVYQHTSTPTGRHDLSQTGRPNVPSSRAVPKTVAIVSVVLLLLLAASGAAWYLKIKRGQRFPSWTRMGPKHITETEMWRHISNRHCTQEQTSKDNNNRNCDNIILQMEEDPDLDDSPP